MMIDTKLKVVGAAAALAWIGVGPAAAQDSTGVTTRRATFDAGDIAVGARLGMTTAEDVDDMALTYGLQGDYALSRDVLVGGSITHWTEAEGIETVAVTEVEDLALGVHGKFFIGQLGAKTRPYALAGLAWHRLSVTTSDEPKTGGVETLGNDDEDVSGELGLDLAAGAVVRVQETVDIGGEARLRRLMDQTVIASDQLALVGTIAYKM